MNSDIYDHNLHKNIPIPNNNSCNKKCNVCHEKRPVFNFKGNIAKYCGKCKFEGMVDVISKKCVVCKIKQPAFNYKGLKGGSHCGDCKLDGMVDVKTKKCISCKLKRPSFNFEGRKDALYCGGCK